MDSLVVSPIGVLPAYETSMRKCERCPTRYLECKRIGEEGYRLCCQCWWELAADQIVYGYSAFDRYGRNLEPVEMDDSEKNNCREGSLDPAAAERAIYQRQVAENKTHKMI